MTMSARSDGGGWEVLQAKYAERMTRKSRVFHEYEQHGLPDAEVLMDYNFWIARRGDEIVLIDTGYDPAEGEWLGEASTTPVPEALAVLGIDPADVGAVVLSHYHFDHVGSLGLFPNAVVYAGAAEHEYWFRVLRERGLEGEFVNPDHLAVIEQVEREGRLRLVDAPTEVADGITVHVVSGHCPGQLLAVVDGQERRLVLASDVAHYYEQVEHGWIFFVFSDIEEMRESFATLRRLAEREGAVVVPGHDPRVRERYPALAGPAGAFANRLG